MDIGKVLSNNLKRIRKQQGLSQEDLSLSTGIARSYMSGIECQRINPTIKIIEKLAKSLKVKPYELLKED